MRGALKRGALEVPLSYTRSCWFVVFLGEDRDRHKPKHQTKKLEIRSVSQTVS